MSYDADFRIICEQHRMSMPNEIYLCETEDEILWCEDDTTDYGSGVRYIRADIHEALRAEVQALRDENRGLKETVDSLNDAYADLEMVCAVMGQEQADD